VHWCKVAPTTEALCHNLLCSRIFSFIYVVGWQSTRRMSALLSDPLRGGGLRHLVIHEQPIERGARNEQAATNLDRRQVPAVCRRVPTGSPDTQFARRLFNSDGSLHWAKRVGLPRGIDSRE
jgi:hypothetical protein